MEVFERDENYRGIRSINGRHLSQFFDCFVGDVRCRYPGKILETSARAPRHQQPSHYGVTFQQDLVCNLTVPSTAKNSVPCVETERIAHGPPRVRRATQAKYSIEAVRLGRVGNDVNGEMFDSEIGLNELESLGWNV